MTVEGPASAEPLTQDPEQVQLDTSTDKPESDPGVTLSDQQREVLFRVVRVAYPHPTFPDGPYRRTAAAIEEAGDVAVLAQGLDDLHGDGFLDKDDAAATTALEAVDTTPFFRLVHSTTVVALYDDREVWGLLGYEGPSFDKGGYVGRGFDDLDWLPDARITELDEPRVELVTDDSAGGRS